MHAAIVASCNAYFAQLAVRLGARALLDTAGRADIPLARNNARDRIRDTLPQIGYGQGEVVASPLRMARIAAAIASDGRLRDVRVDLGAPVRRHARLSPCRYGADPGSGTCAMLCSTAPAAVLRDAPVGIAGKTGTAEVTGAPSHSWFIGFAPFGPAARRVAVAVILENAGYGGAGAAPAAGEILSAAAAAGLVR